MKAQWNISPILAQYYWPIIHYWPAWPAMMASGGIQPLKWHWRSIGNQPGDWWLMTWPSRWLLKKSHIHWPLTDKSIDNQYWPVFSDIYSVNIQGSHYWCEIDDIDQYSQWRYWPSIGQWPIHCSDLGSFVGDLLIIRFVVVLFHSLICMKWQLWQSNDDYY